MKLSYICECCDEIVDEIEFEDRAELIEELANLTEEECHDIMKMNRDSERIFVKSLCGDCQTGLESVNDGDILFARLPILH